MTSIDQSRGTQLSDQPKRYRLPGIEREGIAQLSLLETALWPLQGGTLPAKFLRDARIRSPRRPAAKTASVTVRAAAGLQPIDELILWGLLGATLGRHDAEPVLLATPYWMLRHLGLDTGGSQYAAASRVASPPGHHELPEHRLLQSRDAGARVRRLPVPQHAAADRRRSGGDGR